MTTSYELHDSQVAGHCYVRHHLGLLSFARSSLCEEISIANDLSEIAVKVRPSHWRGRTRKKKASASFTLGISHFSSHIDSGSHHGLELALCGPSWLPTSNSQHGLELAWCDPSWPALVEVRGVPFPFQHLNTRYPYVQTVPISGVRTILTRKWLQTNRICEISCPVHT